MQDRGSTQLDELEEWANIFGERRPTAALTPRLRRPLLATYAALASRLIVIACTLVNFFTVIHLLIQLPGVEGTYPILSSAQHTSSRAWGDYPASLPSHHLAHLVRAGGAGRSTGPRHSPTTKIACWEPFPWWISVTQALDPLAAPRRPSPPSSSPSSKPGSESALFKSTLYTLSAAAAIAHWVFLQPRPPSPLPPEHPPA